jgi:hypothetical protein
MSNKAGPWRKFVQTFFLAEQPNGYFVLNDIFRYLKEDGEVEEEAIEIDGAIQDEIQEAEAKGEEVVHQVEITPGAAATESKVQGVVTDDASPVTRLEDAQANGIIKQQEPTPAEPSEVGMDKKVTTVDADSVPATRGAAEAALATTAPTNTNTAPSVVSNGVTEAPKPAAPSAPKTWANLAASNATKWGSTVSAEARGVSSARDNAVSAPPKAAGGPVNAPSNAVQGSKGHGGPTSVFIKNVVMEQMPPKGLQAALEAQFGPMKECQVIAAKGCAFAEFGSDEATKKAIQMSLPISQGGEGGVKVNPNGWMVIVEEKIRSQGNAARGARGGGASMNRGGRGGGRGGPGGRGGARAAA